MGRRFSPGQAGENEGIPFGSEESRFWFYGRVGPAFLVPPLNVGDVPVEEGVHLELAWEGIGLWPVVSAGRAEV